MRIRSIGTPTHSSKLRSPSSGGWDALRVPAGHGLSVLYGALGSIALLLVAGACVTPGDRAGPGSLEIETSLGVLRGVEKEGVRRFLGVPFAAPPVGDARFRSPRPPLAWKGVRDAQTFAPICAQTEVQAGALEATGDEDCLYLNVYAPAAPAGSEKDAPGALGGAEQRPPVLVWIHGGGRRVGDGRRDVADFVRETGSVVITIQYRLSHFAFFAHPELTAEDPARLASGNYGFEDAIAALRFIRSEIGAFGGDPGRVTIGGLSGGGSMVCGLLVSPHAAGLFDAAIIQSGSSCWFPTDRIELAERRGRANAEALGCRVPGEVAACLRERPVQAFFDAIGRMLDNPFPTGSTEAFAAMPILGGRSGHQVDGFVFPRSWPQAFQAGAFHRVPVLMGVAAGEGRLIYGQLLYDMGSHSFGGGDDYERALLGLTGSREMARAAAAAFPLDAAGGRSAAEVFADVATDAHYACPLSEMAAALGRYAPTYFYRNEVAGPVVSDRIELGAYHGADTDLLFGDGFRGALPPFNASQSRAATTLRGYVAQFLRTGDPNAAGLPAWPRHDATSGAQHLAFDDAPHAESGLREETCAFWRAQEWEALPRF